MAVMSFSLWNCILSLLFVFFTILSLKSKTRRKSNLPPGPKSFPVIGNLLDLSEKPHQSLANLAKIHGPIISLKLGKLTSIVISSASMAKQVLQTHDQFLSNRTVPNALKAHGHDEYGLPWIPVSPLWRNLRKICNNQLFSGKILDENEFLRRKKVEELIGNVRRSAMAGESVDIGRLAFMTTLNLLSSTIFSVDLADPDSEMAVEFKKTVWCILEESGTPNFSDYFPVMKRIDLQGIRKRTTIHMGKVLDLLDKMINRRIQEKETNLDSVSNNDLLHYLLSNDNDFKLEKNHLQHLLLVLFVAGSDTTSATLQWAMAELLNNPYKLSKAQEEIRQVLGKTNTVQESDISKLPYLQAVVKETFRLHPVVPLLLPRKAQKDVEIAGFTVPKDAQVLVNAWAIGRDSSLWENAESFEPERFLGLEMDVKGRNFELIPFGGGRRICPGLPLAMRKLHLMLGSLIQLFDWKVEDGVVVNMDEKFGVTVEMAHPLIAIPSVV